MRTHDRLALLVSGVCLILLAVGWHQVQGELSQTRQQLDLLHEDLARQQQQLTDFSQQGRDGEWDALVTIGDPDAQLDRAFQDLGDNNILKRYQAARAIKKIGSAALPKLLEVLEYGDKTAQESALIVLADMEDPAAAAKLRRLYGTWQDENLRAGALGVLARLRDAEARPLFVAALQTDNKRLRAAGVAGVRRLNAVEATGPLIALLATPDETLAKEAERCLQRFAEADAESFSRAVSGLPAESKFLLVQVLDRSPRSGALATIKGLLQDTDPRVSLAAARVLARRGDSDGRQVVERHAEADGDGAIQRLAREILGQLSSDKP